MIRQPAAYQVPRPAPPPDEPATAPARPRDTPTRLCPRCGAAGTHFLNCPTLRLPAGYRISRAPGSGPGPAAPDGDPGPAPGSSGRPGRRAGHRGEQRIAPRGGPEHPAWPRPPRRQDR